MNRRAGSLVYICFYCKNVADDENELRSHWQSQHSGNEPQPFRFYAIEVLVCLCGQAGTWQELIEHHSHSHPEDVFALLNGIDKTRCALCAFKGRTMKIHFRTKHLIMSQWNRLHVSPENLHKLFAMNVMDINPNKTSHLNFICCNQHFHHNDFLIHTQSHIIPCSVCVNHSELGVHNMLSHMREFHENFNLMKYLYHFRNDLKMKFLVTRVVFQNGVVLRNRNLLKTKYDHFQDFMDTVDEWMEILKLEYEMDKKNDYILKVVVPYMEGEDVKMIFANLRRSVDVQIDSTHILRINRTKSKRAIEVEFRKAHVKKRFKEHVEGKCIGVRDLTNQPIHSNSLVQFEF